jgi:hypothetical protein
VPLVDLACVFYLAMFAALFGVTEPADRVDPITLQDEKIDTFPDYSKAHRNCIAVAFDLVVV